MNKQEFIEKYSVSDLGALYVKRYGGYAYKLFGHAFDEMIAQKRTMSYIEYMLDGSFSSMFTWSISRLGKSFWHCFDKKGEEMLWD